MCTNIELDLGVPHEHSLPSCGWAQNNPSQLSSLHPDSANPMLRLPDSVAVATVCGHKSSKSLVLDLFSLDLAKKQHDSPEASPFGGTSDPFWVGVERTLLGARPATFHGAAAPESSSAWQLLAELQTGPT